MLLRKRYDCKGLPINMVYCLLFPPASECSTADSDKSRDLMEYLYGFLDKRRGAYTLNIQQPYRGYLIIQIPIRWVVVLQS